MPHKTWHPFEDLTDSQHVLLDEYERLLLEANKHVNLVSRASMHEFRDRHILHSLCIAVKAFPPGSRVADFGTGGGLPGIPLAIRFPDAHFILIESVLKKTTAVKSFVNALGLENVDVWRGRAEDWQGSAHYVVSRATASLDQLWRWAKPRLAAPGSDTLDPFWFGGLLCLKGGDLTDELDALRRMDPNVVSETIALNGISTLLADKVVVSVGHKKGRK